MPIFGRPLCASARLAVVVRAPATVPAASASNVRREKITRSFLLTYASLGLAGCMTRSGKRAKHITGGRKCQFTLALCGIKSVSTTLCFDCCAWALNRPRSQEPSPSRCVGSRHHKRNQAMRSKPRQRRRAPDEADLETNVAPDALRDDLRRDQQPTPPD